MHPVPGIFSLLKTGIDILKLVSGRNRRQEPTPAAPVIVQLADTVPPQSKHAVEVAERLRQLLNLVKQGHPGVTDADFAEYFGHEDLGILERLLSAAEPPKFAILDDIADKLGASRGWLKTGKYAPFSDTESAAHNPREYLERIRALNPQMVYMVRSGCDVGYVQIVLKLNRFKFTVFDTLLHVSDSVGATGTGQLYQFYQLIRAMRDGIGGERLQPMIVGRTLEYETYRSLSHGLRYPGVILERESHFCGWWDDLTDIYYSYPIADRQYVGYGPAFVKAQEKIRTHMEHFHAAEATALRENAGRRRHSNVH